MTGIRSIGDRPISPIGLGLAALGRPGYINLGHGADIAEIDATAMERNAHAVLDEAWARGVTYVDAARSYGRAEDFLSSWLQNRGFTAGARRPTVGSKWGYRYVADWRVDADVHEVKELSSARLAEQREETATRLGPFLDLWQIHSATVGSGVFDDAAIIGRLAEERNAGLAIGLSATGSDQSATIERAMAVQPDGVPLFSAVQATWNLLEPSAGPALAAASAAGLTVIVKEALANGRAAGRDPIVSARLAELADGHPPDQVALGAALAQPWADVVLSGAATIDQLRSNLGALEEPRLVLGGALAASGELTEDPTGYWATRSGLSWN